MLRRGGRRSASRPPRGLALAARVRLWPLRRALPEGGALRVVGVPGLAEGGRRASECEEEGSRSEHEGLDALRRAREEARQLPLRGLRHVPEPDRPQEGGRRTHEPEPRRLRDALPLLPRLDRRATSDPAALKPSTSQPLLLFYALSRTEPVAPETLAWWSAGDYLRSSRSRRIRCAGRSVSSTSITNSRRRRTISRAARKAPNTEIQKHAGRHADDASAANTPTPLGEQVDHGPISTAGTSQRGARSARTER
jgi:hypothetical protein